MPDVAAWEWQQARGTEAVYAADNEGPGLQTAQYSLARDNWGNNVIRYNISENDARKLDYGALHIWGKVLNSEWYNNTVYITGTGHSQSSAFQAHDFGSNGKVPTNVTVRNNIAQGSNGSSSWFRMPVGELGYYENQYNSSFLAAGPAERPRLVILCIIDDPGPGRIRSVSLTRSSS